MECDLENTNACSLRKALYKQVQNQSHMCDVTIKRGIWKKVFHWRVLVASPFFDKMYTNDFVEKNTGLVHLHIGTPSSIEMSLLYMYGKKPKLSNNNISEIIELAEFLMIPKLKALCINWLQSKTVTKTTCYMWLKLAILYVFRLPKCLEYIGGHLPEILQTQISKEVANYIVLQPASVYFSEDDKFNFLVRWINALPERTRYFTEMFHLIDLKVMSLYFIESVVKRNYLVVEMKHAEHTPPSVVFHDEVNTRKCLILNYQNNMLNCIDLQRNIFHQIPITEHDENDDFRYEDIAGVHAICCTDFYKVRTVYDAGITDLSLLIYNLAYGKPMRTKVEVMPENTNIGNCYLLVANNECFLISRTVDKMHQRSSVYPHEAKYSGKDQTLCSLNLATRVDYLPSKNRMTYRNITTIYKGVLKEGVTSVHPILVLPGHSMKDVCINKSNVLAMFSADILFLYDQNICELETLHLKKDYNFRTEHGDKLAPSSNGLVIYNNKRVFCLAQSADPNNQPQYKAYLHEFATEAEGMVYKFCENLWFRYDVNYLHGEVLSYAKHDNILTNDGGIAFKWIDLRLPKDKLIESKLFTINVPKTIVSYRRYV